MTLYAPKKTSFRQNKYIKELLRFLSEKITRGDLPCAKDKETGEVLSPPNLVSISKVEMSSDLRHAFAYFHHFEDNKNEETLRYFNAVSGLISSQFAKNLRTKYAPKIVFRVDDEIKQQKRLQDLINQVRDK